MLRLSTAICLTALPALPALAAPPAVLTDIAPVHALVSRVMEGVGTPDLLLPPGASPHDFALRPSDAARLSQAGLVIWVGHGLTPWLEEPLETLAGGAVHLELMAAPGWTPLPLREDANFAHGHEEEHDEHAEEAEHDEHDEHDEHAEEAEHDEHDEQAEHDEHDEHAEHDAAEGSDPHAWLDPAVAGIWLGVIAEALAEQDTENAAIYRANAAAGQAEYAVLKAEVTAQLAPFAGRSFVVPHDAYQYFETAFSLPAAGAISLSDAASPGPARVAELRDRIAAEGIACVLTDPQTSADWTAVLREGGGARTAMVDPDGGSQGAGAALYPALIRSMADALADCLQ